MLPTPPPSPTIPTCAPEDRLGLLLAGHLRLETILGIGAYGVVYTARDVYTGREYAVKALNKVGLDARQRRFQQREIQLHHAASHHPNVVSLLRIMESEDATFVVMEYCHEGDLFASITEQMFYVGNDELIRKAFLQVLDAVRFCHSLGIYHRDLKPENVLCSDDGHTLKLADFGLATQDEYTSDYGCGSTFYMSSECQMTSSAAQSQYASAPNDVWALGVILVNLTCGRNPWKRASVDDPTFRAFLKDPHFLSTILPISEELESILRRIFDCNPATRIGLDELRKLVARCPYFAPAPRHLVCPPSPLLTEYDRAAQQPCEKPIAPQVSPPTPPQSPPAQDFSVAPAALSPPDSRCPSYPTPDRTESRRIPATGNPPAGPCAPLIGADLFHFVPSTGCWTKPLGFHSTPCLPALIST